MLSIQCLEHCCLQSIPYQPAMHSVSRIQHCYKIKIAMIKKCRYHVWRKGRARVGQIKLEFSSFKFFLRNVIATDVFPMTKNVKIFPYLYHRLCLSILAHIQNKFHSVCDTYSIYSWLDTVFHSYFHILRNYDNLNFNKKWFRNIYAPYSAKFMFIFSVEAKHVRSK